MLDQNEIIKLLGDSIETNSFIINLNHEIWFDYELNKSKPLIYSRPSKDQYLILKKIEKNVNSLLRCILNMRHTEKFNQDYDSSTAILLTLSRMRLIREEYIAKCELNEKSSSEVKDELIKSIENFSRITEMHKATSCKSNVNKNDTIDHYPTEFIETLEDFQRTVNYATANVKPGRGNSESRSRDGIRKRKLALAFMHLYFRHFKKIPSTLGGAVHDVFIMFISEAICLDDDNHHNDNEYIFKQSIKKFKSSVEFKLFLLSERSIG